MSLRKNISLLSLTIGLILSTNANATPTDPLTKIYCEETCNDYYQAITKVKELDEYQHNDNMLFEFFESGVSINTLTHQQYLDYLEDNPKVTKLNNKKNKGRVSIQDAALSCSYDADYDCEAWGDYDGTMKPYILDIQNEINKASFQITLTQADIDAENTKRKVTESFLQGALLVIPVAAATSRLTFVFKAVTTEDIVAGMLAGGTMNAITNTFLTQSETKLKAGDIITINNGEVVSIIRDGMIYTPTQIINEITNSVPGGGGGEGPGSPGGGFEGGAGGESGGGELCVREVRTQAGNRGQTFYFTTKC